MNNKFAAASALATCSLLGMVGYTQNEMLSKGSGLSIPLANYSLEFDNDNNFQRFIVQQSSVKKILETYKPSWFYANPLLGNAASLYLIPSKQVPEHETLKVRSKGGQGGYICYNVMRSEATSDADNKPKVLFIVPGVNSSLKDHHICATAKQAMA